MDNSTLPRMFSAGTGHLGNWLRGIWLIFVYWSTIGLAVMILGAHQFYLKVAANAAANPDSALTIGELISKRSEYLVLQDLVTSLRQDQERAKAALHDLQAKLVNVTIGAKSADRKAQIAAQRLVRSIVTAQPADAAKPVVLPKNFQEISGRDLVALVLLHVQSQEGMRLLDFFEQAEEAAQSEIEEASLIVTTINRIELEKKGRDESLEAKEGQLNGFIDKFSKRVNNKAANELTAMGLVFELSSFRNLSFFWFNRGDPMSFVALPGSVLTLLLALAMGALGSTLYVTMEYFRPGPNKSLAWYLFRPALGMITALAVFVAFKAGQLTLSGVSPNSGAEADLNPFLVSFFAVIAGLLSEHAIDRLSVAGYNLFGQLGGQNGQNGQPAPQQQQQPAVPERQAIHAKGWQARFGGATGKSVEGLVAALNADPAAVDAWMTGQEPVPTKFVQGIIDYFALPKDQLFT